MRALLCWMLVVFLVGCSGESAAPSGVLPSKKMEAVLYDMFRADEMVDFLKLTDSSFQKFQKRTTIYDTIFQLHNIRKKEFERSLEFYKGRPDLLKEMLDDLQERVIADTTQPQKLVPAHSVKMRKEGLK